MTDFGMAAGPLAMLDDRGLPETQRLTASLRQAFSDRFPPSPLLDAMVECGLSGRSGGVGFYRYRGRSRSPNRRVGEILRRLGVKRGQPRPPRGEVQERLVLAMVNEAIRALEDGIVASPGECDLALVVGGGFPAARGGLLGFASALGIGSIRAALERLQGERGERFRPAAAIEHAEATGRSLLEIESRQP